MRSINVIVCLLVLAGLTAAEAGAQRVVRHPDPSAPLAGRWAWARQEARSLDTRSGYWIGYSIRRRMGEHSTIRHGSFHSDWSGRRSLQEAIYGTSPEPAPTSQEDVQRAAERALGHWRGEERLVDKDMAILFRMGGSGADEVDLINLTEPFDLGARPLLWLGAAGDAESLALLQDHYAGAARDGLKEDLVAAIGLHDAPDQVVPFLQRVLASREDDDLRGNAAFWLGQTGDPRALRILTETVREDRSREVREQAVFGISQLDLEAATDELIRLARSDGDRDVREKAIFWLGQKASEKAVAALKQAVFDPGDTEVQKQAVFAISQLPEDQAVPMLIDIARTHRNPEVRKQAIFWLGQTGDDRAVDFLAELVQGK